MAVSRRLAWSAALIAAAVLVVMIPVHGLAQDATSSANVESELISLDADNTTVVTILEILAERTGLNIVTSTEVQDRTISIRLRNTPFREALNLVVRAAGLGYERVGNSILVADPSKLATQTGLTTEVFTLEYANAEEVTAALEMIAPDVRSYVSGNRLVVKATQSVLDEVRGVIGQIDIRPAQVLFEARLVEVNTTDLKELGIDWEKITKWTEILVEGQPGSGPTDQLPGSIGFNKIGEYGTVYRQREAVEVAIDALLTEGRARLLANSKITTMNNQEAEIFIGQTIPVVITSIQTGQTGGGSLQSTDLEYIDVGVKLTITPRISGEGFITSTVMPEVSTIVGFGGPNGDLPRTATRRAHSVVRVRDGQKFYLGGLLQEEERETIKKVPLLGDVPILGYLFRQYRIDSQQTDLLIEITPKLVDDEG